MAKTNRKRRAWRLWLTLVLGLTLLLLLLGLLYLNFADLSVYRGTVERLVSNAIGRELSIDGRFEPEIGWTSTLRAERVALANPEWCADPTMVYIERLKASVDLPSLLFGPIRLHDIEIEGARVRVDIAADGRDNWTFDIERGEGDLGVTFDGIALRDVELVYEKAGAARPLVVHAERCDAHLLDPRFDRPERLTAEGDTLDVELTGRLAGRPLELAGRISPVDRLILAGPVEFDLKGRFGEIELSFRGSLVDLAGLDGPDLSLEVHGSEVLELTEPLGLPSLGRGPFRLTAQTSPRDDAIEIALAAEVEGLDAEVNGRIDSLAAPDRMDLAVTASGSNLSAAGALIGFDDLPAEPFSVTGRVVRDDSGTRFRQVEAGIADSSLTVDGELGHPPGLVGTDLRFSARGPDLSVIRALTGLDLPSQPFEAQGRLVRQARGIRFEEVRARVGATEIDVTGTVGDAPEYSGTDLGVRIDGPDLSVFSALAGLELPEGAFRIEGHGVYGDRGITLDSTMARLGENTLRVDGRIALDPRLVGSDLRVHATGPDLSVLARIAEVDDLPAEPFDVAGRVRVLAGGYEIEGVEARIGEIEVEADGRVGTLPDLSGTDLQVSLVMDRLAALGPYVMDAPPLPAEPFSVAGRLRVDPDGYLLEGVAGTLGANHFQVDGRLGPLPEVNGTDLELELSGPNLEAVDRIVSDTGLVERFGLPAMPFAASGGFRADEAGYELVGVRLSVGDGEVRVDGVLGPKPRFVGTDLRIDGEGTDISWIGELAKVPLPAEPFRVRGRVERLASGARFHDVRLELGAYRAEIDGKLGETPRMAGTLLDVEARGPDLALVHRFTDLPEGLDGRFSISGRVEGTPEEFSVRQLRAELDDSDLSGSIRVDLRGKPFVRAQLTSKRLNLAPLLGKGVGPRVGEPAAKGGSGDDGTARPDHKERRHLIPDDPLNLEAFDGFNLHLDLRAEEVWLSSEPIRNLELGVDLVDGRLSIVPFIAVGVRDGRVNGSFVLEPVTGGYGLRARLLAENLRPGMLGHGEDPSLWPPINVELELSGSGDSPRAIAAGANGWLTVVVDEGRVDNSSGELFTADFLRTILDTLNPFRKEEPYTIHECAVYHVELIDGVARVNPMAMRTDKMTMVGRGKVDLSTEKLDLYWTAKPRKGVGLSASALTNPYIKLGGTLSKPSLDIKPVHAVTAAGVAVATVGISILARGLWDRVTAEQQVCTSASRQVERLKQKRQTRKD